MLSHRCFYSLQGEIRSNKAIQLTFRYLSWSRWMSIKDKGKHAEDRNLTFLCQNLAVCIPVSITHFFCLPPCVWNTDTETAWEILLSLSISGSILPSDCWKSYFTRETVTKPRHSATHNSLHMAVPHFPLLLPCCSTFSCSHPEPEVT